ncbi:putative methylesterase 11, chloroplastic [Punica granatum]|uniref:Methylesterase 11, chloroplastic n=2 Tax=Punica granatum TaxID=22663 RepID=A0A6P8DX82_PUNGR|nr:putative methylesterase 11, chloroplastic [Punica granatum]
MGNAIACFAPKEITTTRRSQADYGSSLFSRSTSKKARKSYKEEQDAVVHEQALAAVLLLKQYHQRNNGSLTDRLPLNCSNSVVYPSPAKSGIHKQSLTRSSTARQASSSDSSATLIPRKPDQQAKQAVEIDEVETRHFVLVHGGGFGAWCWYKTMTLLSEAMFRVDAVDLTGSGVHPSDPNSVQTMEQYVKPLVDILDKLGDKEKVILVGHDFGGACVSSVMELYPSKIAKAIFVAASMPKNGQGVLDIFSHQEGPSDLMRRAQVFLYGNGKGQAPTAIDHDKALLKDLLFNQSPAKDYALTSVSMRPIPFGPVLEKLSLSEANYGSVRRFYVETQEDCAIPVSFQEYMTETNPPEKVFRLKGSDHSPFFSKPQALHRVLVEISKIPPKRE